MNFFFIKSILMAVISVFGILGNVISILVLNCGSGYLDLHHLLTLTAVFDTFFLVLTNFLYVIPTLLDYQTPCEAIPVLLPLTSVFLTGSVYSIVALSINLLATLKSCSNRIFDVRSLIILVFVITVAFNFIRFFELYTVDDDNKDDTEEICDDVIRPTKLRLSYNYSLIYIVGINFLLNHLLPIVLLIVFNCLIFQQVKKQESNKQ